MKKILSSGDRQKHEAEIRAAVNAAQARYDALPLHERLRADIAQQRSWVRGQLDREPQSHLRVSLKASDVEELISEYVRLQSENQ